MQVKEVYIAIIYFEVFRYAMQSGIHTSAYGYYVVVGIGHH